MARRKKPESLTLELGGQLVTLYRHPNRLIAPRTMMVSEDIFDAVLAEVKNAPKKKTS